MNLILTINECIPLMSDVKSEKVVEVDSDIVLLMRIAKCPVQKK